MAVQANNNCTRQIPEYIRSFADGLRLKACAHTSSIIETVHHWTIDTPINIRSNKLWTLLFFFCKLCNSPYGINRCCSSALPFKQWLVYCKRIPFKHIHTHERGHSRLRCSSTQSLSNKPINTHSISTASCVCVCKARWKTFRCREKKISAIISRQQ